MAKLLSVVLLCIFWAGMGHAQDNTVPLVGYKFLPQISVHSTDTLLSVSVNAELLVAIKADGSIEYGPHYTPDAAAKVLWESVAIRGKRCIEEEPSLPHVD